MDFTQYGAELPSGEKIPFFHFDDEAQEIFKTWLIELQAKIQTESAPLIAEHLSKYRSLMPSLALIFHLINVADGCTAGPVSILAAEQAAAWCEYLESHARRIYGLLADASISAAAELSQRIQKNELQDGFTLRDVYRSCWHLLDTKERAQVAVDELLDAGWLREVISTEGKTRTLYYINPKIFTANT
jgi:putative DNA primase/helicase